MACSAAQLHLLWGNGSDGGADLEVMVRNKKKKAKPIQGRGERLGVGFVGGDTYLNNYSSTDQF